MRVAALYDIHGNLPALEAVLDDVHRDQVDLVLVGGDVVPGPMVAETLDRLAAIQVRVDFIRGNGETAVLDVLAGRGMEQLPEAARLPVQWSSGQLRPADIRAMTGWPDTKCIQVSGIGDVVFCHATPRSQTEIFTRQTPEYRLVPLFESLGAIVVVCGHTHMQFDRTIGQTRVVNAGSVGMPYGKPGAYWLLLDNGVHFCRANYDLEAAARRVRATGYPGAGQFAEQHILQPPGETAMLDLFRRAELK
jgi:putative phosphoesterase